MVLVTYSLYPFFDHTKRNAQPASRRLLERGRWGTLGALVRRVSIVFETQDGIELATELSAVVELVPRPDNHRQREQSVRGQA